MSTTSKSSTSEAQQTEIDPALKSMYIQNYLDAQKVGQGITDYGPYEGARVAGPTDAFKTGADIMTSGARNISQYIPQNAPGSTLQNASNWLTESVRRPYQAVGSYSYDPSKAEGGYMRGATVDAAQQDTAVMDRAGIRNQNNMVTPRKEIDNVNYADFPRQQIDDVVGASIPRSAIGNVSAGEILPGMKQYQNAYTDAVVDQGTKDLDRARQIAMMQQGDAAVRTGSFGGGRHGVMEGETNRGFADATARLAAEERSKAFNVAAGLSGQDVASKLAASQMNQGADLSMAQLQQGANLTAGQANQQADLNQAALRQQGYLTAGQANQNADLEWARQQLTGGMQAEAANQNMDFQAAMQKLNALNATSAANTDRRMDAVKTTAGFGQQAGLANQQAALDAMKYKATADNAADARRNDDYFRNADSMRAAAAQAQTLANQQYQMPMDAASKLMGLDQYSRGMTNEQIQAQIQAYNDERYRQLQALQLQGAAVGMQLPNLGMSSTGQANSTQTPSGMQTLGQMAGVAGLFL